MFSFPRMFVSFLRTVAKKFILCRFFSQAGAAALYLSQNVDARPSDVRQSILDASEPDAIGYVKPMTITRLLNVNMEPPPVNIHPRSFYNATEGSSYFVVVSLTVRPYYPVTLAPEFSDPTIGK